MNRRIIGATVGTPMNPQTIVDKSEQAKQLEKNTKNIGELTERVDNIPPNPTKVSELENDKKYATQEDLENIEVVTSWNDLEDRPTIPRKVSDLVNDKGYLTSIPSEYVTETELENKGYLTEHQDLSSYAKKNELPIIPTNVSAFDNDKGYLTAVPGEYITESKLESKKYLTAIPSEYVTDTELNDKGYLTAVPSEYALKTDIPTDYALKEHTHDQYLTEHQDLSDYAKTKDHYTKTESDGKYQEKGSYAPKEHEHTQYLTEHQDLSSYAKKTDISSHNVNEEAHNDIRLLIENLVARVNALADSDDSTLDQMSEIVTYIKNNRNLIENVTTEKVNVNDIIDNLITSVSNKPLSAKQGVVLKGLIDAIVVPTKVSELTNDKGYLTQHQSLTDYAKKTELPTKVSQLTNDSGYLTSVPSEYVNETELQTHTDQVLSAVEEKADKTYVDTELAKKSDKNHTHSQYLTSIPSEYVTDTELNAKGYLTEHQSLVDYAKKSDVPSNDLFMNLYDKVTAAEDAIREVDDSIPTRVSQLTNDKNYATQTDLANLPDCNVAYATCETAAATAEKDVIVLGSDKWSLEVGNVVMVYFTTSNSASSVKLNVNGTGAYPIWYNNAEYTSSGTAYTGYAKRVINYMFNGTHWVWVGASYDSNTTYKNVTLGQGYVTCSTAASTTTKVGTLSGYALTLGGIVAVKFTYAVPANATLNINSKGAKKMFYRGSAITAGVIDAGDIATFIYDGTQYQLISIDRVTTETWTFTLEDGTEVTKKVVVG